MDTQLPIIVASKAEVRQIGQSEEYINSGGHFLSHSTTRDKGAEDLASLYWVPCDGPSAMVLGDAALPAALRSTLNPEPQALTPIS